MISSRFVKFIEGVSSCNKFSIRYLGNLVKNDRRTLVGRTISRIASDCNVPRASVAYNNVKKLKYRIPTKNNMWRVPFLKELLSVRKGELEVEGLDKEAVNELIEDICTT